MEKFERIEGEEGLFTINKVKILYEVIPMEKENFFIKKNIDTRKNKILKRS